MTQKMIPCKFSCTEEIAVYKSQDGLFEKNKMCFSNEQVKQVLTLRRHMRMRITNLLRTGFPQLCSMCGHARRNAGQNVKIAFNIPPLFVCVGDSVFSPLHLRGTEQLPNQQIVVILARTSTQKEFTPPVCKNFVTSKMLHLLLCKVTEFSILDKETSAHACPTVTSRRSSSAAR